MKLFTESKTNLEKYGTYIESLPTMDRDLKLIYELIKRYYKDYPEHNYIAEDELKAFYDYCYPQARDKQLHHDQIAAIHEAEVSTSIMTDLVEQIVEQHYANLILNDLVPVIDGNKFGVLPAVRSHIEEFISLMKNPPAETQGLEPCNLTVRELVEQEIDDEGVPWHLENLNQTIGGIRRKTLGCVFAFVDSGKTSFGVAACANFANHLKETGDTIVYAGNEESAARMSLRLTQGMMNVTRRQVKESPDDYDAARRERGWTRIKVLDSISTTDQLLRILDEWKPHVLFIDQGTKVTMKSRGSTKEIEALQNLFNFYREKAKEYDCAIICLAQGVGEAENRKWLKLSDIYGSRVAIQGELDYAIGIGRLTDVKPQYENFRYINVPKNKLLDGATTRFTTLFEKEICRWSPV
jgi:KaiC/GvpD/RAD55 family RecA-like ATPase